MDRTSIPLQAHPRWIDGHTQSAGGLCSSGWGKEGISEAGTAQMSPGNSWIGRAESQLFKHPIVT